MGAELLLIRHGETTWNHAKRLQGRADIALSDDARRRLGQLRPPSLSAPAEWTSSPLVRAAETATLLGAAPLIREPRIIEMDLGAWEGQTLAALRQADPAAMRRNEALGLDMQPPGGESPRMVQRRLQPWLRERGAVGSSTIAVTHKGVIRAIMALALNWDMRQDPPVKLDWRAAHLFELDTAGLPRPHRMNIPLELK